MQFECPAPTAPGTDDAGQPTPIARLKLDLAPYAGQTFALGFRVCGNPCCPCGVLNFRCRAESEPDRLLCFALDVFKQEIQTRDRPVPEAVALGQAVIAEAQPAHWESFRRLFIAAKRRDMRTMDLETIDARLPDEVLAGENTMVDYHGIFPWAESIEFSLGKEAWFVDDQYCVRPGCPCTEAGLTFFRLQTRMNPDPETAEPLRCLTFLFFDYRNGRSEVRETRPGSPAPSLLLKTLRDANPNLSEMLIHRHGQLKQLGRRLIRRSGRRSKGTSPTAQDSESGEGQPSSAPPPAVQLARPGRNDPCPCGSGKKYKKCCGAK